MRPAGILDGNLDKKSRCASSAIAFTVTGRPHSSCRSPFRAADRPPQAPLSRLAEERGFGGGSTARPRPGEGLGRHVSAAFIGTPAGTAQGGLHARAKLIIGVG